MWCLLWQKMLHEGDIYVGVTVRAICTQTLKQYDTKRYEKLSWKNPNPNPGPVNHNIFTVAALPAGLRRRSAVGYADTTW